MLKCLCSDLTQDQFVTEERAGCSSTVGPQGVMVRGGRTELWRILRGTPLMLGWCLHVNMLLHLSEDPKAAPGIEPSTLLECYDCVTYTYPPRVCHSRRLCVWGALRLPDSVWEEARGEAEL